ncbi:MAG: hypothetical protein IKD07_05630 [Clostridia bacterium]|nr:hypothetical protein [Clostridia bacterium]
MVRGCQRRAVRLRTKDSKFFEEAYFFLREEISPAENTTDMIGEANRIVRESLLTGYTVSDPTPRRTGLIFFSIGLLTGVFLTVLFFCAL